MDVRLSVLNEEVHESVVAVVRREVQRCELLVSGCVCPLTHRTLLLSRWQLFHCFQRVRIEHHEAVFGVLVAAEGQHGELARVPHRCHIQLGVFLQQVPQGRHVVKGDVPEHLLVQLVCDDCAWLEHGVVTTAIGLLFTRLSHELGVFCAL